MGVYGRTGLGRVLPVHAPTACTGCATTFPGHRTIGKGPTGAGGRGDQARAVYQPESYILPTDHLKRVWHNCLAALGDKQRAGHW